MDRLDRPTRVGYVRVVKVQSVDVIKDNDHGLAFAPRFNAEVKAAHVYVLEPGELQRTAGDAGITRAQHVEISLAAVGLAHPVLGVRKHPRAEFLRAEVAVEAQLVQSCERVA